MNAYGLKKLQVSLFPAFYKLFRQESVITTANSDIAAIEIFQYDHRIRPVAFHNIAELCNRNAIGILLQKFK